MLRVLLVLLALALPAAAQSDPDWAAFDRLATSTETTLDSGRASDAGLEALRTSLAAWRTQFLAAQNVNSARIATLRDQIAALGPVPKEGESEPADVASRRKSLGEELATAQAPGMRATEAWSRADGLVSQIDATLRARQTTALRQLSPSPLLPSSWAAAAGAGRAAWDGVLADARGEDRDEILRRLPVALALLGLALFILTRGRRFVDHLPARLSARAGEAARATVNFGASLAQIALPVIGVWLAVRAVDMSGLAGARGQALLAALPMAGAAFFVGRWVARQMFPHDPDRRSPLQMDQQARDAARRQGVALSGLVALHQVLALLPVPLSGFRPVAAARGAAPSAMRMTEAAAGVWHLPLVILGALALFRLSVLLLRTPAKPQPAAVPTRVRLARALGQGGRAVALVAPVLLLAGFVAGANALLWPMAVTLGLVGALLLVQQFVGDLWGFIRRDPANPHDQLGPVLIGILVAIAAVPLLLMIWGMRAAELSEVWARLRAGIAIGEVRLSPGAMLTFVLVFSVGYLLTRAVQGGLRTSVLPQTRMEMGAQSALVAGIGYVGIFLAALFAITAAGINLSSLAIVAGALSVGIGFGLQNIVSNFISGIILLVERPIAVGDWIGVGQAQGIVQRIAVRSTMIQTFDRTTVIVPNSDLITKEVTNWTRGSQQGRVIVPVGVAYGSDTRHVEKVLREIAEAQPTALIDPPPAVLFVGFGKDSLNFEIRMVVSDITGGMGVASEVRHQINQRFNDEGIEVPFSQLDVSLKNDARQPARPKPKPDPAAAQATEGDAPEGSEGALPLASGMEGTGDR